MRDSGEPSLIAGITREVAADHPVDPRRIYVAGLSAGAAMAVILGETYPELYAGVGAHSGLPYAAAHDMPSAFAAMAGGRGGMPDLSSLPGLSNLPGAASGPRKKAAHFVPTIVFHGDQDHTVGQGNGAEIVQQATSALASRGRRTHALTPSTQAASHRAAAATAGPSYSDAARACRASSPGCCTAPGHAWAGGDAQRAPTRTADGPDASAEMVRFFLAQREPAPAGGSTPRRGVRPPGAAQRSRPASARRRSRAAGRVLH